MEKINHQTYAIPETYSVRETMQYMNEKGIEMAVCLNDKGNVLGVFSEGDFRKVVYSGARLDENITRYINKAFCFVKEDYSKEEITKLFNESIIRYVPILKENKFVGILSKEQLAKTNAISPITTKLNTKVVIMAGGKGKRLDPFTRILPKPLLPFGTDPVIKVIMDEFAKYGLNDFILSINDKKKMIKGYFYEHELPYNIAFIEEKKPLGTIGALKYLEGKIQEPFFVCNCDSIFRINLEDAFSFHHKKENLITIISAVHKHTVPYGVCEADKNGNLLSLQEKPHMDFLINTGLYIVNPEVPSFLPEETYYDMPTLIQDLQKDKLKVGVYPTTENAWLDLGQWTEYHDAIKKMDLSEL